MKLCNFLRFDPNYSGTGLKAGGKLEEEIWQDFSGNIEKLKKISETILNLSEEVPRPAEYGEDEEEFEERRVLTRLHKIRERSPAVSKKKKDEVLKKTGRLECKVCGFDFHEFYGDIGYGVAECHHTKPVLELKKGEKTNLSDLSIVCANCHRIIHLSKPMLSVAELRKIIKR
jgi:5-methylcytosine-specific restriction enzyme A